MQTLKVFDERPVEIYVSSGVLSEVYPGRVYVTVHPGPTREGVYAIDKATGTVIERYYTGDFNWTEFIHETPDGLLIVTCGKSEKILIIDPS